MLVAPLTSRSALDNREGSSQVDDGARGLVEVRFIRMQYQNLSVREGDMEQCTIGNSKDARRGNDQNGTFGYKLYCSSIYLLCQNNTTE